MTSIHADVARAALAWTTCTVARVPGGAKRRWGSDAPRGAARARGGTRRQPAAVRPAPKTGTAPRRGPRDRPRTPTRWNAAEGDGGGPRGPSACAHLGWGAWAESDAREAPPAPTTPTHVGRRSAGRRRAARGTRSPESVRVRALATEAAHRRQQRRQGGGAARRRGPRDRPRTLTRRERCRRGCGRATRPHPAVHPPGC